MKTILLIIFSVILSVGSLSSQTTTVKYTYDNSGNRTKREMVTIILPGAKGTEITENIENTENAEKEEQVSVEDKIGEFKVKVYPNPTRGILGIEVIDGSDKTTYLYSVFNASGTKLFNGYFRDQGQHQVSMNHLAPGIYILKIVNTDKELKFKIIKE